MQQPNKCKGHNLLALNLRARKADKTAELMLILFSRVEWSQQQLERAFMTWFRATSLIPWYY
jgi:hypothetical protein